MTAKKWCPPDDVGLPTTCVVDVPTAADIAIDQQPYIVAAAIQEAAGLILAADGDLEACGHTDLGVDWGDGDVDSSCCCGAFKTGIVTPEDFGDSPCFMLKSYQWKLRITWDRSKHSALKVAEEANRMSRLLADTTCCLLKGQDRKNVKFISSTNESFDEDQCPQVIFTLEIT